MNNSNIQKAKELLQQTRMYDLHDHYHGDCGSDKGEYMIRVYTILQMIDVEKNDLFLGPELYKRHLEIEHNCYLNMQELADHKWVDNLVDDALQMIKEKYNE